MVESMWIAIPVAAVLGILSGLGTGGGSLLILWLTMAVGMDPIKARVINLLFFLPSALISCLYRRKQGSLRLSKVLPAIISGCAAAAGFSLLSKQIDVHLLKKGFGILLLFAGSRELLYRPRKPR